MEIKLSFFQAILPVMAMVFFILMVVLVWQVPIHLAIFFELSLTMVLALLWGYKWSEVETMLFDSFKNIGNIILILMLIGMLIGIWIASGTVPTMIFYGLKIINPQALNPGLFLLFAFLITAVVSMAVGTASGTASTIGLAFISIARGLGLPLPLVAGAIISGSYIGDRMSPVSSIAIITAHSAETDIIDMVKHMIKTFVPAFFITGFLYWWIGRNGLGTQIEITEVRNILISLNNHFSINIYLLLPPTLIIILALFKVPTILNFIINIFISFLFGLIFSDSAVNVLLNSIFAGPGGSLGAPILDNILARGGLTSMLELISLIILAALLGGLFEKMGILSIILNRLIKQIKNKWQLISITMVSSLVTAMLGCNQFLGVYLPAKMMKEKYDELKLARKELGRALGDSGLILSPLIPWNVNAVMMTGILGVSTGQYFSYAFFPLLIPAVSLLVEYLEFRLGSSEYDNK